jgi:LysM repeat protein
MPVLPHRRPRLQVVGPDFVPDSPLEVDEPHEHARPAAPRRPELSLVVSEPARIPTPAVAFAPEPYARPASLPVGARDLPAPTTSLGRPLVAARVARGNSSARATDAPMRLTARGRVAVAIARFVAALALAIGVGLVAGAIAGAGAEQSGTSVVVAPGESLWSIASAHAAAGEDVRDVAADIAAINGLTSSTVQVGQEIQLPR